MSTRPEELLNFGSNPVTDLPKKQDQHSPTIENCGSDLLTGHQVYQNKVSNVKSVLDTPSLILFGIPNSLLLWSQLSLMQNLLTAHTKFPTDTPT